MRITPINNQKYNNKPAFGMVGKINASGMTSIEKGVIVKNLEQLNLITKGAYAEIKLGISEAGRYFDVKVTDLANKSDSFTANPRPIFNDKSPEANVEQALLNSTNRAVAAFFKSNKP